jgi:hypothetical protein
MNDQFGRHVTVHSPMIASKAGPVGICINLTDRAETETRLWGVTGDINLSIGAGVLIADCALVIGLRKTLQDAASKTSRM